MSTNNKDNVSGVSEIPTPFRAGDAELDEVLSLPNSSKLETHSPSAVEPTKLQVKPTKLHLVVMSR